MSSPNSDDLKAALAARLYGKGSDPKNRLAFSSPNFKPAGTSAIKATSPLHQAMTLTNVPKIVSGSSRAGEPTSIPLPLGMQKKALDQETKESISIVAQVDEGSSSTPSANALQVSTTKLAHTETLAKAVCYSPPSEIATYGANSPIHRSEKARTVVKSKRKKKNVNKLPGLKRKMSPSEKQTEEVAQVNQFNESELEEETAYATTIEQQQLQSNTMEEFAQHSQHGTFTESLNLDPRYVNEFMQGNFLYLRPKHGLNSVYDLEAVEHFQTDPEDYFTMSRAGITHFTSGRAQFTSLTDWEREYSLFNVIRKTPFFAKFRLFKNFTRWKVNVNFAKVSNASQKLEKQLFILSPRLRDAILQVRASCAALSRQALFVVDPDTTYELKSFSKRQQEHRHQVLDEIVAFSEQVRLTVRNACDEVLDLFLAENSIVADHKMTFMERAALRTECRKLAKFIRLVDFQVNHTLVILAHESAEKLSKAIKPEKAIPRTIRYTEDDSNVVAIQTRSKNTVTKPIFKFQAVYDNHGSLQLSPSPDEFVTALETIIAEGVGLLASSSRLLTHPDLEPYTQIANKEGDEGREEVELDALISEEDTFVGIKAQIFMDFDDALDEALSYAEVFEPYYDVYKENQDKVENQVEQFLNTELHVFEELITKFEGQKDDFAEIPISADIGIINVDSRDLKRHLLPSPHLCLMAVKELIPKLMNSVSDGVLHDITDLNNRAAHVPVTVAEFTEKCKFLNTMSESLPQLSDRFSYIKQLGNILENHGWVIPDDSRAQIRMVKESFDHLQQSIESSEATKEEDTSRFIKEISVQVPKMEKEIIGIREALDDARIANPDSSMSTMISYLDKVNKRFEQAQQDVQVLQNNQVYLDLEVSEFDLLDEVQFDLKLKTDLWNGLQTWVNHREKWLSSEFKDLNAEDIDMEVKKHAKIAMKAIKGLPSNEAAPKLKEMVDDVKETLPVVVSLCSNALQARHWTKIHELVGYSIQGVEGFTLGKLIENRVEKHAEEIQVIAVAAAQETVLEGMLAKIAEVWKTSEFEVKPYKEKKGVYIVGGVEDVVVNLDDSLVTISTILGSRYVGGIKTEVETWRKKLVLFQETLDEWLVCQRGWMYLETIFSAPDIQRQLPVESKRFFAVDTFWKTTMKALNDDPNAMAACTRVGLRDKFKNCNESLDKIQKSLEDYLETKRAAFPRFYFLSNDELLEILAQTKDPQAVQPHLRKCFDALVQLDFGSKPKSIDIEAMISPEGERIELGKNLKARGNVEDWLTTVEQHMRTSLQKLMKVGLLDFPRKQRSEWVLQHPGQIVATVAQMTWVQGTEAALLAENSVERMIQWYESNLAELQALIELIRSDLTKRQRKVIVALVTTDVHARDIVERLRNEKISDIGNFNWQMQLRYYWDVDVDDCRVRHSDAVIEFGYEYQGCTSRLVITPLTDRCWMTITGSYGLKLGASPAGPAGTGKTESSKDLAKALGVQCIVFNCSDQIDYKMMGKLFRGLSQCGCWTCLDEFNRIDIEVLSVVAQQLLVLRQGRREGKQRILFMGVDILLKDHHVIVTMNPGYAGRTELPDNLKVCFRPVAMMVPDYALIAEIMLFAEGFGDAKTLSRKMIKLFHLSSQQLSQQPHYDYGLRAVKSVLVMAGGLKRANPDVSEDVTLIRALRDSNVPKLLTEDLPLFFAIVADLFPGVFIPAHDYGTFQLAIEEEIEKANLQKVPSFITKVIQQFDVFNVRFGATIVGPTGAGKTTCYNILRAAMRNMRDRGVEDERYQDADITVLNPKCITMGELYGEFNELTQEWHDGLASTIMRRAVVDCDEGETRRWTVFDGPIDALWIENMNTVLDDNMTLCLANGERIKLKVKMKMLFEVMDLAVASPATVSRLGVMYMSPDDLGWRPLVKTWLKTELLPEVTEASKNRIEDNFEKFVDPAITHVRKKCSEPVETLDGNLVASLCHLFKGLFANVKLDQGEENLNQVIDKLFLYSLIWTIGGTINAEFWESFDELIRELFSDASDRNVQLPMKGQVFDYFVDIEPAGGEWKGFQEIIQDFTYDPKLPYFQLLVPNVDTTRYSYVMKTLITVRRPVFLTGVTGTGKTSVMVKMLQDLAAPPEEGGLSVVSVNMSFSAQTSSLVTQATIESKLEKKRKTLLGAPAGKQIVIFVDDVNMPLVEEYGAQPPIELLRQFLDMKGFYDRDKLFWKDIENTLLLVGAAPPGGGRNKVTPRFKRHFNILCMRPASQDTMCHIFNSILGGFVGLFPKDDLVDSVKPVVTSIVEIFTRISSELLPTPAKSHYTFNLRDVSKVFQGILMVSPKKCQDVSTFANLFCHEALRVFHDRLISLEDRRWFTDLLVELVNRNLKLGWDHEAQFESEWPIIFCDFLKPGLAADERLYEAAREQAKVVQVLEDCLEEYNLTNPSQMNLVFFRDAIEHISRISRIIRQPRGNAMLIGVGGSGKQSCTRLAAFMSEMQCNQIELVRGYGPNEFHEDIKNLMIKAGVQEKQTVFLFTDTQIVEESFLEDINNLLNSGEIPNLFPQDETDRILNDMIPVAKRMGIPETRDNCQKLFVSLVRDNLHVILCMSPVGDSLRIRCRNFPSLINCTTIDWYMEWPKSALESVAARFLADLDMAEELKQSLVMMCGEIHTSVTEISETFFDQLRRKVYTTPKSYLDLIALYLTMLKEKQTEFKTKQDQMKIGVEKLNETNSIVDDLAVELESLKPILVKKSAETEELLKQVAVDRADANIVEERVSQDEAVVSKQAAEVAAVQADAQKDLDVAMPALNAALKALDSLDKKDITEIKSFAKPPPAVQVVMEGVCILLGRKPDWDNSKKLLNESTFIVQLQNYDKDNIPAPMLKKIKKYIEDPVMAVDNVKKVSVAATSLCMWVHAMDCYSKVAKEVAPKREALAKMSEQLDAANNLLSEKRAELQAVRDKVAALQQTLDETMAAKKELEDQSDLTQARLERAEKLTSGLSQEGVRWKATMVELESNLRLLTGDVMVSAGCVSYYGAFTGPFREQLVTHWVATCRNMNIPCSDDCSLQATMGNPVQVREWQINGLPSDDVSADSGILVMRGKRWPLMIDPQSQANKWIKNTEAQNNLEVTKMGNANLLRSIENAIRVGRPLLIEDIDEHIDPSLDPVLQKAVFNQGGRVLIHLGDSDIDYDPNFKFYMTTKMPNPHYLPEVCIKVTIINFTVTFEGLTDQLLGEVVKAERPDIETKKNKLLMTMAADAKQLKDLEAKILKLLSDSQGNILDDEVLINTLANSKTTSAIIHERVEESAKTQISIEEARVSYMPVATRGSIIYFVIADLAQIDPMYQYSLTFFVAMFKECLKNTPEAPNLAKRLVELQEFQTKVIFGSVSRGLFETHKSLFASLICTQIMIRSELITKDEFKLFLRGAGVVDHTGQLECPDSKRLNDAEWDLLHALESMVFPSKANYDAWGIPDPREAAIEDGEEEPAEIRMPFKGFAEQLIENWEAWLEWADATDPVRKPLPFGYETKISGFQKMLLLKVFRPEKLLIAMTHFVEMNLGRRFVEFPPVWMEEVYNDTSKAVPCIFVLSQGADPTDMLLKFAKERGYGDRLHIISLGQGQGPHAAQLIENSRKNGDWVLLQNCHLARSWMPALEKIVLDLEENKQSVHEDFRLYLTSFPAAYFPVTVLQNGVKLTNEPPKGLRANLVRSFDGLITVGDWESCAQPRPWKKLLVGMSYFHALVQERRKFGALGWNISYQFNDTDLETSISVMKRFLDQQPRVPWDALLYVTGEINYGGRVTDDWDRRCLMSILNIFCCVEVLDDSYRFSESGTYYSPAEGTFDEVVTYIKGLPMQDDPEVFGMHENAEIIFQTYECNQMTTTMLALQPRESGGSAGKSSDEIVQDLTVEIQSLVPETLDTESAGPNTFVVLPSGLISSLDTVLSQEIVKFNRLLVMMKSSLLDLTKAVKGLIVMSLDLDKMYTAFLQNRVPELWSTIGFASRKPLMSWVKDLIFRVEFLKVWLLEGQPNAFPLQAFFFPQGFMTGTLQTHARKYHVAVDELTFSFSVINKEPEEITEPLEDGVAVYGLWMEGARFNRETLLMDDSIRGEIHTVLPPIHMVPAIGHKPGATDYVCPVYKTSDRQGVLSTTGMSTNFVVAVHLKTDRNPDRWVLNGCAALLNLDT